MNRRTVLRTAGVAATIGLSGCVEALQEHYEGDLQGLVPIEIHSEADSHYDVKLEAFESGTDRQTYDKSFTVTANQSASPPHLGASNQLLRVTKIGREDEDKTVKDAAISANTELVIVRITNDDLRLELERDDGEEGGPTAGSGPREPSTNGTGTNGSDLNGSDPNTGGTNDTDPVADADEPSDNESVAGTDE